MDKSNLIPQLAEKKNLATKEASAIVNTILETMTDELAQGKSIEIRGFGSFSVKEYAAYEGQGSEDRKKNSGEAQETPGI